MDNKIGICHWSLPMEGPLGCRLAAIIGLDGIQLDIGHSSRGFMLSRDFVQDAYLALGAKYGISFPSITIRELDEVAMTDPEGTESRELMNEALIKTIDAAEAMNIPIVMVPSFVESEITNEEEFQEAVSYLQYGCDYAQGKRITIATENTLSVAEIKRLIKEVDRDNIKLYFDSQNHFLHKDYNIAEILEELIDYVCQVHLKDGKDKDLSGALLGEGDTGFYETMEVLKKHNYSGWLVFENYYDRKPLSLENDNPVELIKKDLQTVKEV
ncbi:sugar phosphate isomerase/epimerase family protein [Halanaerobium hydrogeniformans]|uniref:Xylose isomerase domain-containing protein TIM barrel n=1 Tax=Halanaerobium hydrogeniformans TaxID=656519 RepID=E4RNX1_HALHG|nr:sugar phosphate isomerase/epimerase family protein [Halanaerobium hydrogeniformans]ADQ13661.1 Xylose isomerase domain-containing protein TIM barrel [Halanaerobium hydrogeniformans]